MARRRKSGTASRSNSSRLLAVSGNRSDKPVIAARPRQTRNQATTDRVADCYRHDWDRRCRLLCRQRCLSSLRRFFQ